VNTVFLGLGSNMGDMHNNLILGCELISALSEVSLKTTSPIYKTPPLYNTQQTPFLNMVIEITTQLSPYELITAIKEIECFLGRDIQNGHNLPRPLDIDILAYGNVQVKDEKLTIPHPRIFERKFVLQPWSDIAEDFILEGMNKSIKSLLQNTPDKSDIHLTQLSLEKMS
jgi:2-amino-4-hydroxy-6-hydroxymethyldihydropteridine diphosphokinase